MFKKRSDRGDHPASDGIERKTPLPGDPTLVTEFRLCGGASRHRHRSAGGCIFLALVIAASAPAADPVTTPGTNALPPPGVLTTQQDHQALMKTLGITALRPGRNGMNPQATNYANYDEARANPYPSLPDPLVLKNGQKVTNATMWWHQRRAEIVEDFDREVYGRVPKNLPAVKWDVAGTTRETNGTVPVITKQLSGRVDNSACPPITVNIQATLTTPAEATGPVPVMMQLGFVGGFGGRGGFGGLGRTNLPGRTNSFGGGGFPGGFGGGGPSWQQQVLAKGWGYAIISPNSVQPDNGAGLTQGLIGLCNQGQPRTREDWGALRAWAWGASRLLDYFETDKAVDAKQVGLEGHSRYGKAALVAMAYDPRFAIAYISSSGAAGAKLHRRDWGEIVENVASSGEYHWMAGNYLKYAGPLTWDDLPVDSHELVALCAPRPVFLSTGSTNGDAWVDAKGTFLAGVGASPVYELVGKKGMGITEFPPIETLVEGDVAFRQHSGGHTDGPNWPTFLTFADRYIKAAPAVQSSHHHFDRTISRDVLENYLSRSITMEGLLNGRGDLDDNIRMLKSTGAKFVGRSLCLWGGEANLPGNLERAKQQIPKVHAADPDLILQACIFEIVTTQVEQVPVPDWAFAAVGQPVEKRNFRYADMLYPNGRFKDHWRAGQSVPDVSRPETKLWFYFLGASFIEAGCEAIHLGQTELMNHNDRNLDHYSQVLALIRSHAAEHARRHMVLLDSHVPSGGLVREGQLLMDFHSFPLRIMEVPDKPQEAILKVGFSDGIYGRSKGGTTFSGWTCEHLPYLVEIDNWGVSQQPGQPKAGSIWIWGYDEITWFAHQSQQYRSNWLRYAWDWVRQTDSNGFLQMPGSRTLRSPLDGLRWYYANKPSPAVPDALNDEEAIRAIWAADSAKP